MNWGYVMSFQGDIKNNKRHMKDVRKYSKSVANISSSGIVLVGKLIFYAIFGVFILIYKFLLLLVKGGNALENIEYKQRRNPHFYKVSVFIAIIIVFFVFFYLSYKTGLISETIGSLIFFIIIAIAGSLVIIYDGKKDHKK